MPPVPPELQSGAMPHHQPSLALNVSQPSDTQRNDMQRNDTQRNDTQRNDMQRKDTQRNDTQRKDAAEEQSVLDSYVCMLCSEELPSSKPSLIAEHEVSDKHRDAAESLPQLAKE